MNCGSQRAEISTLHVPSLKQYYSIILILFQNSCFIYSLYTDLNSAASIYFSQERKTIRL